MLVTEINGTEKERESMPMINSLILPMSARGNVLLIFLFKPPLLLQYGNYLERDSSLRYMDPAFAKKVTSPNRGNDISNQQTLVMARHYTYGH